MEVINNACLREAQLPSAVCGTRFGNGIHLSRQRGTPGRSQRKQSWLQETQSKAGVKVKKLENTRYVRFGVQDLIVRQIQRKAGSLCYPNEGAIFIC